MDKNKIIELINQHSDITEKIIEVLNQNIDLETEKYQKLEDTIEIIDQLTNQHIVVYDSVGTCFDHIMHYSDQLDEIDIYDCRSLPGLKRIAESQLGKIKDEIAKWESLIEYVENL